MKSTEETSNGRVLVTDSNRMFFDVRSRLIKTFLHAELIIFLQERRPFFDAVTTFVKKQFTFFLFLVEGSLLSNWEIFASVTLAIVCLYLMLSTAT